MQEGELLWEPSETVKAESEIRRYMHYLHDNRSLTFGSYADLWHWSVTELEEFWRTVWDFFGVRSNKPFATVLSPHRMPGAKWFAGAELNYAEHALRRRDDHPAVVYLTEAGHRSELSYRQLAESVRVAAAGLVRLGVQRGDRVVAFMPNAPETLVAFLACASLGAIWSSCSPEFGVASVLDRFRQIEPKVLLAVDSYEYGGKVFDRTEAVREIQGGLASLGHTVLWQRLDAPLPDGMHAYSELQRAELTSGTLSFEAVPFDHPLWILYSSGTTGLPKAIVQGHGGIVLEHLKALGLHCDLGPSDRFFWFTTTGWMMWNFLIGGLMLGSTVVLYEGSPAFPDLDALWRLAALEKVSYFGTSAPYLLSCRKAGIRPHDTQDLSALRAVGSTGAPLPVEGFEWVYDAVSSDVLLGSVSGGTDVCTAFVISCPLLPVRAGHLQCNALGAKVEAFGAMGQSLLDEVGELVITEPMPSMPLFFWNDPQGERLRESYFSQYPGVWRHGDWIKIAPDGSSVIYGRSDSTLNRGGVRMGTSEFYSVVESVPGVLDSVVVDTGALGREGELWLFVVPAPGHSVDAVLKRRIASELRTQVSPRHVPDVIVEIREVPRTLSGKKLEVPIKRVLSGMARDKAVNPGTLQNPTSFDALIEAGERARAEHG